MKISVNTFKHPADCECNQPFIIQTPAPSKIATDMIVKVLASMVVFAAVFLVSFVLYSFITA